MFNLLKMARDELRPHLLSALRECTKEKSPVCLRRVTVKDWDAASSTVSLMVRSLVGEGMPPDLFLVIFEGRSPAEIQPQGGARASAKTGPASRVASLEQELQATKEYLETTIEELETANEELKSANEELQSTNEELQSTNEELETAKEELQSTNEELVTVNSELQNKVEELIRVNDDVSNLLTSSEVGTIILDRDLKIKRFTPAATLVFNLIDSDIGRSLRDISVKTFYKDTPEDAERVLKDLQVKELDVQGQDGSWYSMRLLPYRTRDNLIDGVVITFMDITDRKEAEKVLWSSRLMYVAQNLEASPREPFMVLDGDLKVITANPAFYAFFKTVPAETEGLRVYELGNRQWDIPQLRDLLEQIIPEKASISDFAVEHHFPVIGSRKMMLKARRFLSDQQVFIILAFKDVTPGQEGEAPTP